MKIAHIDLYFHLPDDHDDNDLIVLLEQIIEYKLINQNKTEKSPVVDELKNTKSISKYGYDVMMYNKFMKSVKEKGYKLCGDVRFINAMSDKINL
jgi:uncharacterized protein with ParB-like and HNH nuclease domain